MRKTKALIRVLSYLLDAPGHVYGYQIMNDIGIKAGSLYPMLKRIEQHKWLVGRWEDPSDRGESGPRRRLYALDPEERGAIKEFVASAPLLEGVTPPGATNPVPT